MTNTRAKLSEARFFLDKMKENRLKKPDFDYYLNAFISSARSVTWVMKHEYIKIDGWEKWWGSRNFSEDEQTLLKQSNDLRTKSQKEEHVISKTRVVMNIPAQGLTAELINFWISSEGKKIKMEIEKSYDTNTETITVSDGTTKFVGQLEKIYPVLDEVPDNKDVLEFCENYWNLLLKIVEECEQRFPMK